MSCDSILLVEDDASIREMLKLMLELEGYTVSTAENGAEGLTELKKLVQKERPCLILLDLMMPVMNGWQFLEVVGQDKMLAAIPVVIVTAFSNKSKTVQSSGVIKKPIEIDALYSMVHRYCGHASRETAAHQVEPQ